MGLEILDGYDRIESGALDGAGVEEGVFKAESYIGWLIQELWPTEITKRKSFAIMTH